MTFWVLFAVLWLAAALWLGLSLGRAAAPPTEAERLAEDRAQIEALRATKPNWKRVANHVVNENK